WEKDRWEIGPGHELHNLPAATVVYVRARAHHTVKGEDAYEDEGNFVPYVAFIFEETVEPTCSIARIERNGVSLSGLGALPDVTRAAGGVLNFIPDAVDGHILGNTQQTSAIAQVDLYYKLARKDSRDGSTLLWELAGTSTTPPFSITWDVDTAGIGEGRYDVLLVATDQAGNKSVNPYNNNLTGYKTIIIDRTSPDAGPTAYIEDPDELSHDYRLPEDKNVVVSASSYTGGLKHFWLRYSEQGMENWIEIKDEAVFDPPTAAQIAAAANAADLTDFTGYYYWDENGNLRYDAGEPVWLDKAGGNTGKYNNTVYTAEEDILMGSPKPSDEQSGKAFGDMTGEDAMKDLTGTQGVTKWADIDGVAGLSQKDFIWIDLDDDDEYDEGSGGVAEPIVYASVSIPWQKIMDLPPTNNTAFDLKVKAIDLSDSSGADGLWGEEYVGDVRVENIVVAVWKVNGREVINEYILNTGGAKDYTNEYQRVAGDKVTVELRVWPYRSTGVDVQLWYRYDDDLYPGAVDNNYNGFPDDADDDGGSDAIANSIANSKWDGIDNDFDGTIDEEQVDKDGDDDKWGEVNVWRQAVTTVVAGPTEKSGVWEDAEGMTDEDNSFAITLEWDVSQFEGEFQFQFLPIVVDSGGYGVDLNYADLPFTHSEAKFPQSNRYYRPDKTGQGYFVHHPRTGYKVIVDHQGPYTYSQVTKDDGDYGDDDDPQVKSFRPLQHGSDDDMIVRTNDGAPGGNDTPKNDKRKGSDDYHDDTGENNYQTYDLQAKVWSIAGGLDYTKTLIDQTGGVEYQYRVAGGTWNTLGYDYDPDYVSTFLYDPATGSMLVDNTVERGQPNDVGYVGAMVPFSGDWVDKDGNITDDTPIAYTQRIVVSTFCLDNVDITDAAKFALTNGTEYEFRIIATDLTDKYGDPGHSTVPDATTKYDEYVVENRIGSDKAHAVADENFMRDINWKKGAPFSQSPADVTGDVFRIPHVDIANLEAVRGPRTDGDRKDLNYWVDNIVPKAEIIRVDEESFAWTAAGGVDPVGLAQEIDAAVHQGDHVLVEAIGNDDPAGTGTWGTTADDMAEVRFYARPRPLEATTNTDFYKKVWENWGTWPGGTDAIKYANGWMQVGMGDYTQADAGSNRYTIRIDTQKLVEDLSLYPSVKVPSSTRDFQLMAMAVDDNGNEEPFLGASGEVVIRVLDMVGPSIEVGGLALDMEHYKSLVDSLDPTGIGRALIQSYLGTPYGYLDVPFTDIQGLAMNNFGNAIFPANSQLLVQSGLNNYMAPRRPLAKVSGELLHLYVTCAALADVTGGGVTISVYDKDNTVAVSPDVVYASDAWKVATETKLGEGDIAPGTVAHMFTLSEQTALLYLPAWTDADGNNVPRFENAWLHYRAVNNEVEQVDSRNVGSGSGVAPPSDIRFGDSVAMTSSVNSKGERIWKCNLNLEIGKTYFYYFVVDTVGDTWIIPDPKNLSIDELLDGSPRGSFANMLQFAQEMLDWLNSKGNYTIPNNLFLNLPFVSKIWVPGTPGGDDNIYGADDEIWSAVIDLDALADGVYEIRVEATDKVGYKAMVSKTIVLDRTPPAVADIDLKVDGRVKADEDVPLVAIVKDPGPPAGINAVDTVSVLFEKSRRPNTEEAITTWSYALTTPAPPPITQDIQDILDMLADMGLDIDPNDFTWYGEVLTCMDVVPDDGWTSMWHTPVTDQNVPMYVRAVPFDDALNVQVGQLNQVEVIVDGTVPKAKVVKASVERAGATVEDGADGFELYPDDTDVTLTAEMVANIDGDLDNDGIIEPDAGESAIIGVKGVTFEYSLKKPADPTDLSSDIEWIPIPATQYSNAVRVPTTDGKWQAKWQVDFSQLINEEADQYIHVRAVAEDEVGNVDDEDTILCIMVLNNITGPQAYITEVDGTNSISPHLAVTKRTSGTGDPGAVDVVAEAHNVAVVTLEYRAAGATAWTEVETVSGVSGEFTVEWVVATLDEGRYELRVTAFDGDGNMATEPDVVVVIVDHTEPAVSDIKMWVDEDRADGFEGDEAMYPDDAIYRYADSGGEYYDVKIEAVADATDPTDKVEAKEVVLQYFHKASATWKDVPDADFGYSKVSDKWTIEIKGKTAAENALGELFADGELVDGKIYLRVLVTDYAGNQNNLDRGFELTADANAPIVKAVYSGGREWEGGAGPTIVAEGGDPVDLWAKVVDTGSGVSYVKFCVDASPIDIKDPDVLPVPRTGWDEVGSGTLDSTNGREELWHFLWTTPLNMKNNNWTYKITAKAGDNAANEAHAQVLVEKDVTPPAPPQVLFVVTHAGRLKEEYGLWDSNGEWNEDALPYILDEYYAPDYTKRKMLPIGVDTNDDSDRADRYEVFDLYNDWAKGNQVYIDPDQHDTAIEIWVRTPDLEF
ncbi:MAG: hypothetical protein AMJ46_14055, partial [Latescibacteria bacterium DG_63]